MRAPVTGGLTPASDDPQQWTSSPHRDARIRRRTSSVRDASGYCWSGTGASASEFAPPRRSHSQAEQQRRTRRRSLPVWTRCGSARARGDEATASRGEAAVRPRDCVPMHSRVRACSGSMARQTATTAFALELGSEEGLDGTIGFDGTRSRCAKQRDDRFPSRASGRRTIAKATIHKSSSRPVGAPTDDRLRPKGGAPIEACDGPSMAEIHRCPARSTHFCFVAIAAATLRVLPLSNTSSEGVAAGHSAAPRRLQETGVSTR